jgi:hypothetical protein
MIRKKGRGGARKNAGRPKVVKGLSWIEIGVRCERLQKELAAEKALKKYESLRRTKQIREAQKEIVKGRITKPLAIALEWMHAGIPINAPRAVSLKIRRIATRRRITELVSDEQFKKGHLRMTPRRVRDCWERYRQFLEDSKS